MSAASKIEWTEATWNPTVGCTHVSAGCDHCYAAREASGRLAHLPTYAGLAHAGRFTGEVRLLADRLAEPLKWRKPRRVFVDSMSDLFHTAVPDEFIARVFAVMAATPQHTYQVLTKRPARMRSLLGGEKFPAEVADALGRYADPTRGGYVPIGSWDGGDWWPLPNVWLGVSVEDQKWADIRIPALLDTPAAVRFVSCEPLLGPVDLGMAQDHRGHEKEPASTGGSWCVDCTGDGAYVPWTYPYPADGPRINWVIAGGESGPDARPMHPQWARDLRDQCQASGVPFFFKQWGEWAPDSSPTHFLSVTGAWFVRTGFPGPAGGLRRVGKKAAGRLLDGRTWDEYPA